MRRKLLTGLLVWVLSILAREAAWGDNLLVNGDFEQGETGKGPPGWIHRGFDRAEVYHYDFVFETCAEGRNGTKGARVEQREGLVSAYVEQDLALTLDEDRRYEFSAWVRSERTEAVKGDIVMMVTLPGGRVLQAREKVEVKGEWGEVSAALGLPAWKGEDGTPAKVSMRAIIQFYTRGVYFIDDARLEGREDGSVAGVGEVLRTDPPGLPCPIGLKGGFVVLKDGTLAAFTQAFEMKVSPDGGRSWGEARALDVSEKVNKLQGVFRTSRGRIMIWTDSWKSPLYAWYSDDEGATWSKRINVGPHGMPLEGMRMIETRSGRLALPVLDNWDFFGDLETREEAYAYGTIDGKRVYVEGHGHVMELERTKVYYSDDHGVTWQRNRGDIVIWKDEGYGGTWTADEPNIVELKDGRLMLYFRTVLGRVYASYSPDAGHKWSYPEATELANSISPVCLKRFPETGDLLLIWNNVSADEIRRGFRRGRLCSAVSRDDGKTWEHVKTIDTAGLAPVDHLITPEPPGLVNAEKDLGELPAVLGRVSYADAFFVGDRVLVKYDKGFMRPEGLSLGMKLLEFPVEWFTSDAGSE
ncbi:MAG: exo-alpha-sialidase [Planctomycetota bacterium]